MLLKTKYLQTKTALAGFVQGLKSLFNMRKVVEDWSEMMFCNFGIFVFLSEYLSLNSGNEFSVNFVQINFSTKIPHHYLEILTIASFKFSGVSVGY